MNEQLTTRNADAEIEEFLKGITTYDPELDIEYRESSEADANLPNVDQEIEALIEEIDGVLEEAKSLHTAPAEPPNAERREHTADISVTQSSGNTFTFAITTEHVDRMNEVVRVAGVDTRHYQRNPVVLWCHDSESLPIGRGERIRVGKTVDGRKALLMDVVLHDLTPMAREVLALAQQGVIRAGSIGFLPLESQLVKVEKSEFSNEAYPISNNIREFTRWELLEFSLCSVPMNPHATITR